jgi:rhomboid protease GluP
MAFGFPPKYVQDVQLDILDKEHFLVLAIEAALQLNYNINFVSENGFIAHTPFSWNSWGEIMKVKIEDKTAILQSQCNSNQLFDLGKNKKNIAKLLSKIEKVQNEIPQDEIDTKLIQLREAYVPKEYDVLIKPSLTLQESITDFFSLFKPAKEYFISPILVNLNLLIFIVMLISGVHLFMPESQDLLNWGANFRPMTLEGQWWRLLTACFLHIGIIHLLLNMYALLYIGALLEPILGKVRFLTVYLISGIAASVTSLWWHDLTISAGASGAIFGLFGFFLALLTTNLFDKSVKNELMTSIILFIGYNIVNGIRPNSGIDNAAHIGGLLSGFVLGYAFIPSLKQSENKMRKYFTIGILTIITLLASFAVYRTLPNDIGKYEEKMKEFVANEAIALEVYKMLEGTPKEKMLSELKNKGLYHWHKNLKLIENFKELDLPALIQTRNSKLKKYCELRIKSYELIYKAIEEDTNKYDSEIKACNKQLEQIVAELSQNNN